MNRQSWNINMQIRTGYGADAFACVMPKRHLLVSERVTANGGNRDDGGVHSG